MIAADIAKLPKLIIEIAGRTDRIRFLSARYAGGRQKMERLRNAASKHIFRRSPTAKNIS